MNMETLFFVASKFFWVLVRPESWLVLLLSLSVVSFWRGRNESGRRYAIFCLAMIFAIGTVPLGEILLRPLESRYPPDPMVSSPSAIIVLGGGEDPRGMRFAGLPQLTQAGERLLLCVFLSRQYPAAKVIFTGGSSSVFDQTVSGSEVADRVSSDAGLDRNRVLLEGSARNTAENASLTRALVDDPTAGAWILVTSAFHMPRALGSFCAAGWQDITPYPVDFRSIPGARIRWDLARRLETLNTAIKEWIGLVAYRASGRSNRLLPLGC